MTGALIRFKTAVACAALIVAAGVAAWPSRLQVLAPDEGSYASGPTPIRARVEPAGAAASVLFYADGRLVCTITHEPFECDWDAGPAVTEHQIRVVANLTAGGRVVQNLHTKGIAYPESVNVFQANVEVTAVDVDRGWAT